MTAKEKALELVKKYWTPSSHEQSNIPLACKCATIAIDEILEALQKCYKNLDDMDLGNAPKGSIDIQIDWYTEVKQEIEEL